MEYSNPQLLWSTEEVKNRLDDPDTVILDLRTPEDYSNGHIPGARCLDIFGISLIDTRREPLAAFLWIIEHLIAAKGVSGNSCVVIHDRISGERAARLFWFLELFGHRKVHVLNGGFQMWQENGLPITHAAQTPQRGDFRASIDHDRLATAEDVLERLGRVDVSIVDARTEAEHNGTLVRSARGGHIPGAVHLEWTNNLSEDGTFKSALALMTQYAQIGVTPDREVIPYCQGGYRSAHTYMALRLLGYPRVRNYLGSWGEWGNRSELPVERP